MGLAVLCAVLLGTALAGSLRDVAVFVASLAVFVLPGFFLPRFGFVGAERYLVGCALGYLLTSLLASGFYRWGAFAALPVACASLLLSLGLAVRRRRAESESRGNQDRGWLAASMLLAMVIVAIPFLHVGAETPEGVRYRAYFSADLMTHLSVVGELQKGGYPPQNPFYAGEPLGYYWLFFLFPTLVGGWIGNQEALLLTYLSGGLLFAGLAYVVARSLVATPARAFLGVLAGLAAGSFEGVAVLARLAWLGKPLGSFRNMNVDGFSRWIFELTSLDGLHRSLLYTPQHLFSYSLLLILVLLVLRDELRGWERSALAGGILGGMAGTSIVTAMLAGPWIAVVRMSRGGRLGPMARDLAVVGLVSFACLAWYFELGYFGGAGAALSLRRPRILEIPAIVLVEGGPLVLLAMTAWKDKTARRLAILAGLSFVALLGLDVRDYEGVWMAWRAGSVLLISLFLMATMGMGKWRPVALALILVTGSWTMLLDVYNAQDITNREMSAGGFRWTTVVSHGEMEAFTWLREQTGPSGIVQWDSRARPAGEWALIPALARRRMAVGFPIFLLDERKYRVRERRDVRPIFTSGDPVEAHRLAVRAGIDYLFIGRRELEVRGDRLRSFWEARERFRRVFSNRDVTVFEVEPRIP